MNTNRYVSQIVLPEVGVKGQQLIAQAKVLVIGAGGLGCPVLSYLTGMGIGKIGIMDNDTVKEENLHRQVLYRERDIGDLKVNAAQKRLMAQNSTTNISIYPEWLTTENAARTIDGYDIVIDCSDNIETRYLIDSETKMLHKPWIYGAVARQEGQMSVFNYKNGPSYTHLFPYNSLFPTQDPCSMAGIMGYTTGIMGCLQVSEAVKIILNDKNTLNGYFLTIDLQTFVFRKWKIKVFDLQAF